jgi:hypothetical protein
VVVTVLPPEYVNQPAGMPPSKSARSPAPAALAVGAAKKGIIIGLSITPATSRKRTNSLLSLISNLLICYCLHVLVIHPFFCFASSSSDSLCHNGCSTVSCFLNSVAVRSVRGFPQRTERRSNAHQDARSAMKALYLVDSFLGVSVKEVDVVHIEVLHSDDIAEALPNMFVRNTCHCAYLFLVDCS